ncbi:MarR family transcriptional regulator [Planococcus salinus]|uniref:MarR family transcriptional regulator n=1 Tax=Planococcus salinus TaxID=1848460 RepID=A0A3M8P430_9BACL|nr:helix-turn-helix domain-containing protein [Planococcus salinus]RNF38402.1 MarR family transcriptional regulator [Planococcus salinus]
MVRLRNEDVSERQHFTENKLLDTSRECFAEEPDRIMDAGDRFMKYFLRNASPEGVLFKTIKEITSEMNIPHQTLSKVLKRLEEEEIIYRRNGIIGLWRK